MTWSQLFRGRSTNTDTANGEHQIDDELMFHLRALVDEKLAQGVAFDAAWQQAQKQFGSLKHYSDECRKVSFKEQIMLQKFSALAVVVMALLVGWLLLEVRSLREQVTLRDAIQAQTAARAKSVPHAEPARQVEPVRQDVAGRVLDANVLVIVKTWPNGRYRQEAFDTVSDAQGGFRLPKLVPGGAQFAIQVAALKHGYTLTSMYQLCNEGSHAATDAVTLRCEPAARVNLVVHDRAGEPVSNARVFPSARQSLSGAQHVVYFQASEPIQVSSDELGRVGLDCFERGDQAEIYVRLPGHDWQQHKIAIPGDGDVVVVPAEKS